MRRSFIKILSIVLCFVVVLPMSVFAQQPVNDYSKHWAADQIKSFLDKGFISADKNGNFKPNDPITRGDFAVIANKAFGFTEKADKNFKDVMPNENYSNDILIAKKAGYLIGLPDGTVMPGGYMSRQEFAVIISRLLKLDTAKYINKASEFKDASGMPGWSKGAIGAVANAGYMQGEPGNLFNSKGFITRGQAVAVLARCYLHNIRIAYNKPGTYSASVIDGSAEIDVPDVRLENTTINGDLIIGEGVGEGTVRLKNVIVKGDTIVKGGGLHSVIIEDSQIKNIIIIKEDNKVRILAMGSTSIEQVDMQSGAKLEEQGITGTGFGYVTIAESVDSDEPIILIGDFDSVQIQSDAVKLDVEEGSIKKVDVAPTAVNTEINLAEGVQVTELVVSAKTEVTGAGNIETADVRAQDTVITVPTATTKTADGVTVATALPTPTPVPTQSTGGSTGGSPQNISVSSITVTGTGNVSAITSDNGTLQMVASVMPASATIKSVSWSVTNGTGTAAISNSGLLKAVSNGTVKVRATANDESGKYGEIVITISNQVPTIIYTSSSIANGAVDPDIVVNLINDTFAPDGVSNLPANWTCSSGLTNLTAGSVTRNSNTQMTLHLTGTAQPGTLTFKLNAAALAGGNESNSITVFVLPAASGVTGTIDLAETINGGENAAPVINGHNVTFSGEIAYYVADEKTNVPMSANWVGVKITAPAGVTPNESAVFYVNGRNLNKDEISGWSNIIEEGDGADYFHIYQRVTDLSRAYTIVIKWNNEVTEEYSISFAPSAALEPKHGTIYRAETTNGGENATTTISGRNITFNGEIAYITADESNNPPISGNWVGVKITAPEGVYPDENAVLTAHGNVCNRDGVPGWDNIREEGDGDNYFYLYQRVRNTGYVYEVEIKWNNEVTETYSIIIPRATTLEYSDTELTKLGNMITVAQTNYDNAVSNANINPAAIAEFGDAITAAAAVRDNTSATMPQIYAAQEQLAAAMNKFDAEPIVQGTIERAETTNGGENATTTISGRNITFNGEIAYIMADESNNPPISGNWVGVKITAPEGVYPDENAVLTAHGNVCNRDGVPGWDNIREEGDGDNYFYLYQRVRNTGYVYEVEIKWNNEVTETYSIIIPRATTLEYSDTELTKLGNMITVAQTNYDNAVSNANINPAAIAEFGDAITAAAAVRDNTGAAMPQIYAAQEQLAAAMSKFDSAALAQ